MLATAAVWELFCFASSPRASHPTLSYLVAALTAHPLGRAMVFAAWLATGWYWVAA